MAEQGVLLVGQARLGDVSGPAAKVAAIAFRGLEQADQPIVQSSIDPGGQITALRADDFPLAEFCAYL